MIFVELHDNYSIYMGLYEELEKLIKNIVKVGKHKWTNVEFTAPQSFDPNDIIDDKLYAVLIHRGTTVYSARFIEDADEILELLYTGTMGLTLLSTVDDEYYKLWS